jgi:hypothetical protein
LNLHQEHNELKKDYTKLYQEHGKFAQKIKAVEQEQQPIQHGQAQAGNRRFSICKEIVGTNRVEFQRHVKMFHPQKLIQAGAG